MDGAREILFRSFFLFSFFIAMFFFFFIFFSSTRECRLISFIFQSSRTTYSYTWRSNDRRVAICSQIRARHFNYASRHDIISPNSGCDCNRVSYRELQRSCFSGRISKLSSRRKPFVASKNLFVLRILYRKMNQSFYQKRKIY